MPQNLLCHVRHVINLNQFTPADIFWKSLFVGCDSHSMELVKSAVEHINSSHIPVIAVNQQLLSLAKQIQRTLDKCIMKINMSSCLVDSILKWQPSKCLVSIWALVAGQRPFAMQEFITQAVADSFLGESHLTLFWRAHQVFVLCWCTIFATLLSSACESFERSSLYIFQSTKSLIHND